MIGPVLIKNACLKFSFLLHYTSSLSRLFLIDLFPSVLCLLRFKKKRIAFFL